MKVHTMMHLFLIGGASALVGLAAGAVGGILQVVLDYALAEAPETKSAAKA